MAENKNKELSRASLSSDSVISGSVGQHNQNLSNGHGFAVHRLSMNRFNSLNSNKNEPCNGIIEEEKVGDSINDEM